MRASCTAAWLKWRGKRRRGIDFSIGFDIRLPLGLCPPTSLATLMQAFVRSERSLTDVTATLAKTAKGVAEVTRHAHRLPNKLRSLLIMIDGHATAGALISRFGEGSE